MKPWTKEELNDPRIMRKMKEILRERIKQEISDGLRDENGSIVSVFDGSN